MGILWIKQSIIVFYALVKALFLDEVYIIYTYYGNAHTPYIRVHIYAYICKKKNGWFVSLG